MFVHTWDNQDVKGDTTLISIQSPFSHLGWEIAIIFGPILFPTLDGVKCSVVQPAGLCNGRPLHSDNVRTITFPLALPLPCFGSHNLIHSPPYWGGNYAFLLVWIKDVHVRTGNISSFLVNNSSCLCYLILQFWDFKFLQSLSNFSISLLSSRTNLNPQISPSIIWRHVLCIQPRHLNAIIVLFLKV